MILLAIATFFVLMCVVAWLLLFPVARELCATWTTRAWARLALEAGAIGKHVSRHMGVTTHIVQSSGNRVGIDLKRHHVVLVGAVLLICVPSATILFLRQTVVLDGYSAQDATPSNLLIAELLRGERLTPPPPPLPEIFMTAEVMQLKPEIVTADRKWDRIDADLQQRVLAVYRVMREQYGYEMVLTEGYRSPERQAALPASVTRAGPWQSCHQYGLAADSAILKDGKLQWNLGDAWVRRGYMLYGKLAAQAGLDWGGNWTSFKDYPHVERSARCSADRKTRART